MANIQKQYDLFIDGKFVPASDGKTFEAHNPANGEVLAFFCGSDPGRCGSGGESRSARLEILAQDFSH